MDRDMEIIALAARQHGVVARWQLVRAGVPATVIDKRLRRGRLERVYYGVYRLRPLAGPRAREVAAVLTFGAEAALSHDAAACVFELVKPWRAELAVSVPGGHPARRINVRLYRVHLPADERCVHDGIPITTPARTLLDLASIARERILEQAVAMALRQQLTDETALLKLLARHPHRPGAAQLRALLACPTAPAFTRSEAEENFLALCRQAGLAAPATNVRVIGFEVDFLWRTQQLVVEIDGLAFHSSRHAQRQDRRRDTTLVSAGYRVLRFTWSDLVDRPIATAARVAEALAR